MEYQKRPGYVRAFILILFGAVLILISTTISGSDLPAYTKICPPSRPLCTNLTNSLRPVENLWNSFITYLRQVQPSIAEFAENYVDLVVVIAGLVLLVIGVLGLLTAIFRSIRQFRSKDRSVYAKRERKLRKFFDQEPIRFGSAIPWLLLTVVFIAIVYWLNVYYPISDQICKQSNWLCQKNEYTLLLDIL
jgi:predicted PurR-regulated permease PerM